MLSISSLAQFEMDKLRSSSQSIVVIYMVLSVHVCLDSNKIYIVIRIGSTNKRTTEVKCEYTTLDSYPICCAWPSAKKWEHTRSICKNIPKYSVELEIELCHPLLLHQTILF